VERHAEKIPILYVKRTIEAKFTRIIAVAFRGCFDSVAPLAIEHRTKTTAIKAF
jgi:hypothetical protein